MLGVQSFQNHKPAPAGFLLGEIRQISGLAMVANDESIKLAAEVMEKGGIAVTTASLGVSWMGFLDEHSRGILALCSILGLFVTVVGAGIKWVQMTIEHRERMNNIRNGR